MSYIDDWEFTKFYNSREITESFLNDLINLPDYYTISINNIGETEDEYLGNIRKLLEKLLNLGKRNEVKFSFSSFNLMNKNYINSLLAKYPYVTLTHDNLHSRFTSSEYLDFYHELTNFLKPLILKRQEKNLSPLELYTLIYNEVVNYREYQSYPDDYPKELDVLQNIFSSPYFVCRDFVKLLVCSLSYMGIPASMVIVNIDEWQKGKLIPLCHARSLVRIVDPKYGLDGYYLSDPTFDEEERFSHALIPFRDTTIENELQRLNFLDLFFDIKSREEFALKMQFLFSKVKTPIKIFIMFLREIKPLDTEFYSYLYNKYGHYDATGFPFTEFLEDVYNYLIIRTNQDIDMDKIMEAYMTGRMGNPLDFEGVKKLERLKKENALAKYHFFWDFWPYDMNHKKVN